MAHASRSAWNSIRVKSVSQLSRHVPRQVLPVVVVAHRRLRIGVTRMERYLSCQFVFAVIRNGFRPQDHRVHANDQDFLVIRAVENGDLAALRKVASGAPKEIVP